MRNGILMVGMSLLMQMMAIMLALPWAGLPEWQPVGMFLAGFALYANGAFIVVNKA